MNDLECIICCVNYADILSETLGNNLKYLKYISIITIPTDSDTIKLCDQYKVKCITTELFHEKTFTKFEWKNILNWSRWGQYLDNFSDKKCFNKAKAINYAIKNTNKQWILLLDADIILPKEFASIQLDKLSKTSLYSCNRYVFDNRNDYENNINGYYDHWQFVGFFQLFNKTSKNFSKRYYGYDENNNYANTSDFTFMKKWHEKKLLKFTVIHLGKTGKNWKGRTTNKW